MAPTRSSASAKAAGQERGGEEGGGCARRNWNTDVKCTVWAAVKELSFDIEELLFDRWPRSQARGEKPPWASPVYVIFALIGYVSTNYRPRLLCVSLVLATTVLNCQVRSRLACPCPPLPLPLSLSRSFSFCLIYLGAYTELANITEIDLSFQGQFHDIKRDKFSRWRHTFFM